MGREEGDNGMGVSSGDGRKERGGMEGAGVKKVRGSWGIRNVSNRGYGYEN
jgi:hypothetical protein